MSVAFIGGPARLLDQLEALVGALTSVAATDLDLGGQEAVGVASRVAAACDRLAGVRLSALAIVDSSGVGVGRVEVGQGVAGPHHRVLGGQG